MSDSPSTLVELVLEDDTYIEVNQVIANRVRGIDADGDILVVDTCRPAGASDDSAELIPLTPCCQATGKGSATSTGVACRRCYKEVDFKYGGSGTIAIRVAPVAQVSTVSAAGDLLTVTATALTGPSALILAGAVGDDPRALGARVRAALANSAHRAFDHRIRLNLGRPGAAVPTTAAIAVAAMAAAARTSPERLADTAVLGNVNWAGGLSASNWGGLPEVGSVLAAVQQACAHGARRVIVPWSCRAEAGLVDDIEIVGAHSLTEIADLLSADGPLDRQVR